MPAICLYFQVHQPLRIKKYRVFDVGSDHDYFGGREANNLNNKAVLAKVAEKSYLPANRLILKLLKKHAEFKISYSLSGVVLEQLEKDFPKVLDSFRAIVATGQVEVLAETYYHSLSFFYSLPEFESQVRLHEEKIKKIFGVIPKVFRNTELAYTDSLGMWADQKGYKGILAEGWDGFLGWRSPNFVYRPAGTKNIKLLLKNYKLSDDIAFRFSDRSWSEWPLTAQKFSGWLRNIGEGATIANLFMDYETFGEHQWEDTGIFDFLESLPVEVLKYVGSKFVTPKEAVKLPSVGEISVPGVVTWADTERDLSAWTGNMIQKSAIDYIYGLRDQVLRSGKRDLIDLWRKFQTSDHFYYMCTKWFADGDVHKYFNPYDTPYDAFISYMNAASDLKILVDDNLKVKRKAKYG